jgi:hypothetical protein
VDDLKTGFIGRPVSVTYRPSPVVAALTFVRGRVGGWLEGWQGKQVGRLEGWQGKHVGMLARKASWQGKQVGMLAGSDQPSNHPTF